jgi:branched-chain amino acid transport system substrate-binding protein
MSRQFRFLSVALMVIMLVTMLLGCQQATTQTPKEQDTKGPIKIGYLTDLTGPIASSSLPQMESAQEYMDYVNSNGGILGHPLQYEVIDTKYDNSLAVAGFEKLANQGDVFYVVSISANFLSVCKPLTERYKITLVGPTEYGSILPATSNPYLFGNGPAYADYYRSGFFWIKENWKKQDPPKIAIMGADAAFAKSCIKGVKWMLENEFKWPIVAEEWMSLSSTNATSQVTNIKNAKPDYVVLCSTGVPQIVFHKTAKAMGLMDETVILDTFLSSVPAFRAADKAAMEGVINFLPVAVYPQMATEAPYLKTLYDIHAKKHPNVTFDWIRTSAMVSAMYAGELHSRAIKKYMYKNLSGEKIKSVLENDISDYNCENICPKIITSPTNHVVFHDCNITKTTSTFDVDVLYKWYKMPAWPSIAGDPSFWK